MHHTDWIGFHIALLANLLGLLPGRKHGHGTLDDAKHHVTHRGLVTVNCMCAGKPGMSMSLKNIQTNIQPIQTTILQKMLCRAYHERAHLEKRKYVEPSNNCEFVVTVL